jgi:hypothetical protein
LWRKKWVYADMRILLVAVRTRIAAKAIPATIQLLEQARATSRQTCMIKQFYTADFHPISPVNFIQAFTQAN